MMNCPTARRRLGPYIDGELSNRSRFDLETHITACPACRHELKVLRRLGQEMAGLEVPSCPPYLSHRITARAGEGAKIPRIIPLWMAQSLGLHRWYPAAAALACGLIMGSIMGLSSFCPPPVARDFQYCMEDGSRTSLDQGSIEAATLALLENRQ